MILLILKLKQLYYSFLYATIKMQLVRARNGYETKL